MQYKILNEQPWQILSNSMTISPSSTGYDLQVSANGKDYTTLFSVGAGITRQVTNLSSGSYFRMKGNEGEVIVNWVRDCSGGDQGGGSGSGTTYTAGEYISIDQDVISVTGITPDLYLTTADTQDFATQADITAATSPIQSQVDDIERVTATALTELHDAILEISGSTGGSNYIIPAITSLTDYEAISGSVKPGDLIQVFGVDINDDGGDVYGLFEANEIEPGVFAWNRKDNGDSLLWSDFPWMHDIDVYPIDLGDNAFLVSPTPGEDWYGIGFDADGKPTITHIVPEYDEQTGEFIGVTREDTPLGPDQAKEEVIANALVDLNERKVDGVGITRIVKLTQAEYDDIANPDPETFYLIVND